MLVAGSGHSASKLETVDVVCTCASCGVVWTLRVRAVGVGFAVAPFFIGRSNAKATAANAAHYDAIATAQLAVSFVECRACGHSLVARRRHWLVRLSPAFIMLIGAGVLFPAIGPHVDPAHEQTPLWEGVAVGVFLSAIVLYTRLRDRARALDAAEQIEWFRGEPPDKPHIGVSCEVCKKKIKSKKGGERCPECGAATHRRCAREHAFAVHAKKDDGVYRRPGS
jgi:predicted RNA-binding Zn-ribbon protein involved in translation (DUF1610 family)